MLSRGGDKMVYGKIDLQDFEYLIKYSTPDKPNIINTWTLPEGSFQMNYKSMIKDGYTIYSVYKRMTERDLLDVMIRE